jgi:sulfur carrier protein ThiS
VTAAAQSSEIDRLQDTVCVRVRVHGLLTAALEAPGSWLDVEIPAGTDVEALIQTLSQQLGSPLFDRRSCMATVGGVVAPLDQSLRDGAEVEIYHLFSGG